MVDFIKGSIRFISENLLQIILVSLIFCLIMVHMVVHDVRFLKTHPKLEEVVIVENLSNPLTRSHLFDQESGMAKAFCEQHKRDPKAGDAACRKLLSSENCNLTNCCGWATYKPNSDGSQKAQCVAANALGMTFIDDDLDTLYFKNKKVDI